VNFKPFNFLKLDPGATKLQARLDKEANLTKITTPCHKTGNDKIQYEPKPGLTNELLQLRDSVAELDTKLQAVTIERDKLKTEFNDYRKATQADQRDLEKENQRIQSQLRETGQQLSQMIASTGQPGPIPSGFENDSPHGKTEAHYLKVARQMKSGSTGEPATQRLERP